MVVKSISLRSYIEGIYVPVVAFKSYYERNTLGRASLIVPLAETAVDKMWANAFIQVTYIDDEKVERLLFQGLCDSIRIMEHQGLIEVHLISVWDSLNFNTTLDYVSPRKYKLTPHDQGLVLYIGNESIVYPEFTQGFQISNRYFYIDRENLEVEDVDPYEEEAFKLESIIQRTPFAERFAFNLFELFAYDNFILTRAYVNRFNLLRKRGGKREKEEVDYLAQQYLKEYFKVKVDIDRTGRVLDDAKELQYYRDDAKEISTTTTGGTLSHDGPPINLMDYVKNYPNKDASKWISFIATRDKLWCTKGTAQALVNIGQKLYDEYGYPLLVNDICKLKKDNDPSSGFIGTGWHPHRNHQNGRNADLLFHTNKYTASNIDGKKDLKLKYNPEITKDCIKAIASSGALLIIFGDSKRKEEFEEIAQRYSNNTCHYSYDEKQGHNNHFHVNF